jgi:hypothetical protein
MERKIFSIVLVTILLALPASGGMVRGIISDSATGAPISNVKVVLMLMEGELNVMVDSSRTGTIGSYAFPVSSASDLYYIQTISDHYYYQSINVRLIGVNDTIAKDIKLKRILTMVSAAPYSKAVKGVTVRTAKSWLYLSGIKAGAIVNLYTLNGRLLFRTVIPAGASDMRMPKWIAAIGSYQVSIRANGHLIYGMVLSR